jgi:hypothetical protein
MMHGFHDAESRICVQFSQPESCIRFNASAR